MLLIITCIIEELKKIYLLKEMKKLVEKLLEVEASKDVF